MQKWQPKNHLFCIFSKNGSYLANICYSISVKSSNFALKMCKSENMKMRKFFTLFALSTMTLIAQTPINIFISSKTFTATLADSETGEAFLRSRFRRRLRAV